MKNALIKGILAILVVAVLVTEAVMFDGSNTNKKDDENNENQKIDNNVEESVIYNILYGEVNEVISDEEISIKLGQYEDKEVVVNVAPTTIKVDNDLNVINTLDNVKTGDKIGFITKDVIEETTNEVNAEVAIYGNINNMVSVSLHRIESIELTDDGARVLTDNGGMLISIKDDTLLPYKTKQVVMSASLEVGDMILTKYDIVLESYPGQAFSEKTLALNN